MLKALIVTSIFSTLSFSYAQAETPEELKSRAEIACLKFGALPDEEDLLWINMLIDFGFKNADRIDILSKFLKVHYSLAHMNADFDTASQGAPLGQEVRDGCVNLIVTSYNAEQQ